MATHFRLLSRSSACLLTLRRASASASRQALPSAHSCSLPRFSFAFIGRLSAPPTASSSGGSCFSTRATSSSLNDSNPNWSNRPPKETILLDGCDFEHWLVVMEKPEGDPTRDEIIDRYIKTLAKIVGSEEEARMKIYSVSTRCYFAFGALVSEEDTYKLKELEGVRWVLPDSYLDVKNKDYGGEPFIDGNAVPYDPKYHEEWIRNNARANERNRRNDRPRNFDRSRNFDRRRENMQPQQQNAPPFNQGGSPPPNNMPPNPSFQGGPPNPNFQGGPPNANFQGGPPNANYQGGPPNANYQRRPPNPNQGYQNQQGFQGGYQNQGPQNPGYGGVPPNQGYRGGHPDMNYQSQNMGRGMSPPGGMPPQQQNMGGPPPPPSQEWGNNPQAQQGFQDSGFNPSRDPGTVPAARSY